MTNTYTGGCMCGEIRWTLKADKLKAGLCHCFNCQKLNGSAFSINQLTDVSALDISNKENLKSISFKTDTDETQTSDFCGSCGSQIQTRSPKSLVMGVVAVKLGGLDPEFKKTWQREGAIEGEIYTARRFKWLDDLQACPFRAEFGPKPGEFLSVEQQ